MKQRNRNIACIVGCILLFILILDPSRAIAGASEGIMLCVQTVIPSLFPFLFLTAVFQNTFSGRNPRFLRPLSAMCHMPRNAEMHILTGLIGGYPVGARCVYQAYQCGGISKKGAQRLLGFCNNAGPAFIVGILGPMFTHRSALWIIWMSHIICALFVGWLLDDCLSEESSILQAKSIPITKHLENSVATMAFICGWIVLFRALLNYCKDWFLWSFPTWLQVAFAGVLELSNGCIILTEISDESFRLILAEGMLSFGGFCVLMQTSSVTKELGLKYYFPGKLLQTLFSVTLCCFLCYPLYHNLSILKLGVILLIPSAILCVILKNRKINIEFSKKVRYNDKKAYT